MVVMTMLLSCSKLGGEFVVPGEEGTMPLVFAPSTDWQPFTGVKSSGRNLLVYDINDLKKYSISLLGSASLDEETYPVFSNQEFNWTEENGWGYSPLKYWINDASYQFSAFCPYIRESWSNGDVTISSTDPSIIIENYNTGWYSSGILSKDSRSEDLLYAKASRNTATDGYGAVSLNFEHLLSCVTFNIKNSSGRDITSISGINLKGLDYLCRIEINLTSATIVNYTDEADTQFNGVDITTRLSNNSTIPLFDCTDLTVLPQSLYYAPIFLQFTVNYEEDDSVPYELNLGNIEAIKEWEANKKYTYNLTISSSSIDFSVSIADWIEDRVIEL